MLGLYTWDTKKKIIHPEKDGLFFYVDLFIEVVFEEMHL